MIFIEICMTQKKKEKKEKQDVQLFKNTERGRSCMTLTYMLPYS